MRKYIRHPKGFKIFLTPEDVAKNDEYRNFDPYTVARNINSDFHCRRIRLTAYTLNACAGELSLDAVGREILVNS